MIFSAFRNTLRYSHVDRESAVTNATAILPNTLNRSRPQRNTQESILGNQSDLTAKFDTFGFKHTATTGLEVIARDLRSYHTLGPAPVPTRRSSIPTTTSCRA